MLARLGFVAWALRGSGRRHSLRKYCAFLEPTHPNLARTETAVRARGDAVARRPWPRGSVRALTRPQERRAMFFVFSVGSSWGRERNIERRRGICPYCGCEAILKSYDADL